MSTCIYIHIINWMFVAIQKKKKEKLTAEGSRKVVVNCYTFRMYIFNGSMKLPIAEYETHERFVLHQSAVNFKYLNSLLDIQNISVKYFISETTNCHFNKRTLFFNLNFY